MLFASDARVEASRKAWLGSVQRKANVRLSRTLTRTTKLTAERTGFPVFHIPSKLQIGESFGERLQHAFASVFAQGYERVLAIGNDCIGLRSNDLIEAANRLEYNAVVAGPTPRGGIYVLGLRRSAFETLPITGLAWLQPNLFQSLQQAVSGQHQQLAELPIRVDANTLQDLIRHWHLLSQVADLRQWLRHLLFGTGRTLVIGAPRPVVDMHWHGPLHRGPPC
ncbi:MAG: DUF2064 domain-containing protein [Bacteroidota bacterium]